MTGRASRAPGPKPQEPGPKPQAPAPRSLTRPPSLRPGDRVAIICASGPVDPAALDTGLDALRFAGLEPVIYDSATEPGRFREYLAGDDKTRAADLAAALTDPGIAGVIFAKGGYGAQRTLELLDWDAIAAARELRPKVLAGYSDVTALLEAVAVKLGWASLFGPMPSVPGANAHYSFGSLLRTLTRPADACELSYPDAVTVTGGTARGVTMGGTLTLLSSSIGTGTSWPARGGILLLEDVEEEPYRLDRMLTQLRRSGYLDGVAGLVTGTFTDCGERDDVHEILVERLGDLKVPMLSWANVGHGGRFQTFPVGIAAELDADSGELRLLDPPLQA
ncbi:MAG TPA: LD-carboxypeptidase [Trebonia sp.]|jgi:muramoyltetrapeptide carboxypeptidase